MASTSTPENEAQAGPFQSNLAPEAYTEMRKGETFLRDVFQIYKMTFTTPADESQQFLDIGCGTGESTRDLILPSCEPCKRIVAVDFSPAMLKYAREKYAHEKIAYEYLDIDGDVSAFVKTHGAFQRVYSFRTLHWSRDLRGALRNIAELMLPGGECLLMFFARSLLMETFRQLSRLEPWSKYADILLGGVAETYDIMDPKEQHAYMSEALSSAGLVPYSTELLVKPEEAPGSPGFLKRLYEVGNPMLPLLNKEEKAAFLETLSTMLPQWHDLYCKKSGPMQRLCFIVHARKPEY
ncbi:hypothetical protein HPB50_011484 [Hyalomma asiaticum]|uniref:Uncharacterized protein n=1 Tax=Hyalomma asiaticum TaxID=266040 RepID=A0ACB7T7D0_HYAAI|nr:hypothetical protein HPB50_011484 [Hyalomma asiaticum]